MCGTIVLLCMDRKMMLLWLGICLIVIFYESKKAIHYFEVRDVNTIYLYNVEKTEKSEYKNKKYNELYLKFLIRTLEVLCKKELD